MKVTLVCDECGAEFQREESVVNRRKRDGQLRMFCSRSCSGKARWSLPDPKNGFMVRDTPFENNTIPNIPIRFNTAWRLDGDFLIISDLHIPATDWAFANRAVEIARKHLSEPRRLIIAGDLLNLDAVSKWDTIILNTPLRDELEYARAYLNFLASTFEEIYYLRGNHEDRLFKKLGGELGADNFLDMINDHQRIHFSMYSYCTVGHNGSTWRVTHQRNYSQLPLRVASRLADKHGQHIICAHQHRSAIGRSQGNQFALIDMGGCHDPDLMAYVSLDDSTSPTMSKGFVLLRGGIATLFTPEDYQLMDWSLWM